VPLEVGNPRLCFLKCKEFVNGVAPEQVGMIASSPVALGQSEGRAQEGCPKSAATIESNTLLFKRC
jgi:hypothetical protein